MCNYCPSHYVQPTDHSRQSSGHLRLPSFFASQGTYHACDLVLPPRASQNISGHLFHQNKADPRLPSGGSMLSRVRNLGSTQKASTLQVKPQVSKPVSQKSPLSLFGSWLVSGAPVLLFVLVFRIGELVIRSCRDPWGEPPFGVMSARKHALSHCVTVCLCHASNMAQQLEKSCLAREESTVGKQKFT